MGNFIKKDMRIILRDRKELAILILMPFILIAILGFALGGFLNGEPLSLHMKFALVIEDQAEQGVDRFLLELEQQASLPQMAKDEIAAAAQQLQPIEIVMALFDSEDFTSFGTYTIMDAAEAELSLEQDEFAAIITIPDNFTYHLLNKMILNSGDGAAIELEGSADYAVSAGILEDILNQFTRNVSFQTVINQLTIFSRAQDEETSNTDSTTIEQVLVQGGVENVTQLEPFTSIQYYTFGMAVMFVLYVAATVAGKAFNERRRHTFDRIIMAGSHPIQFLSGKAVSAISMALLQLLTLFLLSTLIFQSFIGKSLEFWIGLILISIALAFCIGGLSALLISINFRARNENSTEIFGSLIVSLISLLGGSFFPTWQMADWVATLGQWTPNGAALFSFLQVTQGADAGGYLDAIIRLVVIGAFMFAMSVWIFPRRKVN